MEQTSEIHSDGFRAYDGLVEAGFAKHHRITHGDEEFTLDNAHINGIESFWSFAKRRMAKFNGIRKPASRSSSRKPNSASIRAMAISIALC